MTPRHVFLATLTMLVVALCASAKDKKRDWQTGKVLDSDRTSRYVGNVGNASATATTYGGTAEASGTSSSTAVYRVHQVYAIELGDRIYIAREVLRWRWSKPANLTVNAPIRVAIEKNKLYILDEDGKEHEATIQKKILKPPEEKKP
jgi:hypothetical protein